MEPNEFAASILEKYAEENDFPIRNVEDLSVLEAWLLWEMFDLSNQKAK